MNNESAENQQCPKCGAGMVIKSGPIGRFYSCETYPACRGTRSIKDEATARMPSADDISTASKRLTATMAFIVEVGGVDNAYKCLRAAQAMLMTDARQSDKKTDVEQSNKKTKKGEAPF